MSALPTRVGLACWLLVLAISPLGRCEPPPGGTGEGREILRIRVVNDASAPISVSCDHGATWTQVGRVVAYTTRVNARAYTAAKWIPAGQVAATAVNAIHISAGYNAEEDRGVVFSLLPREFLTARPGYTSFLSPDSSIYTDIPAGTGIFGGGDAPFVGSPVQVLRDDVLSPVGAGYQPARGDVLIIRVLQPAPYPVSVEFENRPGGEVALRYPDGSRRLIGWVIHPVGGIGRFLGSLYAGIGRIRANHAGVVDISTSPIGNLGAFQIIPVAHALSPEMSSAWHMSQWLIVGPARGDEPLWGSITPLFYQHLRPQYRPGNLSAPDWRRDLLSRFLVEVDLGEGWRPMPALRLSPDPRVPLPQSAHAALREVRRIRVLFPLAERK